MPGGTEEAGLARGGLHMYSVRRGNDCTCAVLLQTRLRIAAEFLRRRLHLRGVAGGWRVQRFGGEAHRVEEVRRFLS